MSRRHSLKSCRCRKKDAGSFGGCPARVKAFAEVSPADKAAEYLRGVLRQMGAGEVSIDVKVQGEGCVLTLNGDDVGFIIGRRGETLDALQYLTGLVANRVDNAYYRVTIDVGNYREKRDKTLAELARKVGGQAAKTGRKTSLEPMNPMSAGSSIPPCRRSKARPPGAWGSEPNRHVVVALRTTIQSAGNPSPRGTRAAAGRMTVPASGERSERPQREAPAVQRMGSQTSGPPGPGVRAPQQSPSSWPTADAAGKDLRTGPSETSTAGWC